MILTPFDTVKRSAHMSVAHSSRAHMSETIKKDGSSWHWSSSAWTAPPPCHLVSVDDASICLRVGFPAPPGLHRCHLHLPLHRRSRATWSLSIAPSSASALAVPRRQTLHLWPRTRRIPPSSWTYSTAPGCGPPTPFSDGLEAGASYSCSGAAT
jgi:hypothetical protein